VQGLLLTSRIYISRNVTSLEISIIFGFKLSTCKFNKLQEMKLLKKTIK
jgi:hypothetical protein